uniref:Transmembrane protein n=1 Tax=Chromera velia CCMP2878 TaxID=1169474 RepID=A0A0G4HIP2_9ALVE|eukprot:Cvel_6985.t1-p1 / transcript=Cvel_6985.t1 / gene=Cvel_6985 / organism=Chromera_velia_CCMP2878 / gene_product=hypothetical protein / transcript_product=hypothetical protein / location=Cvel_scaffold355:18330-25793(-) / protein_length=1316 / sequence_SO=supercontig / SO=protein_coding / is_pseudo=false
MDSQALASSSGEASEGGGAGASDGASSSSGTTLTGTVVVTAPAAEKPSREDAEAATAASVKIMQAVDNIADNLAEAVPIGETTIIKTETLSIAVQSSPPDATSIATKSDSASIVLQLADAEAIAAIPQRGDYEEKGRTIRQSMPANARRSDKSDQAKSLTLMESVSNPAPFAGARTRENGFVTAGLTPFIRMAARQGGEVIGGIRTSLISSGGTGTSRSSGGRSARRLEIAEDQAETLKELSLSRELSQLASSKNVAQVALSAPEQENLIQQRELVESDWDRYKLGREGGIWEVECAQLDVQNEEWTKDGLLVGLSSIFIFLALAVLVHTAYKAERKLLPVLQDVFPSLSVCDFRRRQTRGQAGHSKVSTLKDIQTSRRRSSQMSAAAVEDQSRAVRYHSRKQKKGRQAEARRQQQREEEGTSTKVLQEVTAKAKAVFGSEGHVIRIRKFFNPRRIVAYHLSQGVRFDENGQVTSRPQQRASTRFCSCGFRCFRLACFRDWSLGACDARVMRRALKVARAHQWEAQRGYAENQTDRQQALWKQMEVEMAGRQYEMGFVFSTEEIRARVLRAMREQRKSKGKNQLKKKGQEPSEDDSDESSDFDSDSSGTANSKNSSITDSSDLRETTNENANSQSEDLYEELAALMHELQGIETKNFGEKEKQKLEEKMKSLKEKTDHVLPKRESEGKQKGHFSPSLSCPADSSGRGGRGEVLLTVPSQSEDGGPDGEPETSEETKRGGSLTDLTVRQVEDGAACRTTTGRQGSGADAKENKEESSIESAKSQEGSVSIESVKSEEGSASIESAKSEDGEVAEEIESAKSGNSRDERKVGEQESVSSSSLQSQGGSSDAAVDSEGSDIANSSTLVEEQPTAEGRSSFDQRPENTPAAPPPVQRNSSDGSSPSSVESANVSCSSISASIQSASIQAASEERTVAIDTQSKERQTTPEKKSRKPRRLKSTAAEVFRRLSACGLGAPAKRWRAPMTIVAPADASRVGTLPLRMSMKRNLIAVKVSKAKLVFDISDLSILTEALVFASKMLLTLTFAFFLCLMTVIVGETDERHTNRRPSTIATAPGGFGLEGYGDLEAFLQASALKALIACLAVELLFASLVMPVLQSIWSPQNSSGRVDPQVLIWRSRGQIGDAGGDSEGRKKGAASHRDIEGDSQDLTKEREGATGERRDFVHPGAWGLTYFGFPPGLSRETKKAKVPRAESARLYIRARRQEVVAQYILFAVAISLLLLLLMLFLVVGLAGESFPVRHKQFVLREYLLSSLLIFCFALGFPVFLGVAEGIVVWSDELADWNVRLASQLLSPNFHVP